MELLFDAKRYKRWTERSNDVAQKTSAGNQKKLRNVTVCENAMRKNVGDQKDDMFGSTTAVQIRYAQIGITAAPYAEEPD